jgi:hypothetical protein
MLGSGGFAAELFIADEGIAELNASNPLDLSRLRRVIAFGLIREAMETPCGHVRVTLESRRCLGALNSDAA